MRAAAARTGVARAVAAPTTDKPAVPFPTVGSRPPGEAADSVRGALTRRLPGEGEARTIGGGGSGGGATPIVGAPADARPPGAVACGGQTKAPVPARLGSGRGVPGKVGAGRVLSRVLNGSGPSLAMTGRGRAVLGPPSCVRSTLATTRAECVGAPAAGAAAGGRRLAAGAASSESGLSRAGLYGAPNQLRRRRGNTLHSERGEGHTMRVRKAIDRGQQVRARRFKAGPLPNPPTDRRSLVAHRRRRRRARGSTAKARERAIVAVGHHHVDLASRTNKRTATSSSSGEKRADEERAEEWAHEGGQMRAQSMWGWGAW